MSLTNVLVVKDSIDCPEGEGELIKNYLFGVFNRVSKKVAEINPSRLDLLVIKSDSLVDVTFSSQCFFEDYLNKSLAEVGRKESCPKHTGHGSIGSVKDSDLIKYVKRCSNTPSVELNFLSNENIGICNVAYYFPTSPDIK
jgi:hypothetical protein